MLVEKVKGKLKEINDIDIGSIEVSISDNKIVTLKGQVKTWKEVVKLGHTATKVRGVKNVVNDITAEDAPVERLDYGKEIEAVKASGKTETYDVVIIGAGISGCSIAKTLSKYDISVAVVEKNSDIAEEATKANNGNIHPGALATPGTLKAKLNLLGNKMYTQLSKDLDFELKRPGSLVVFYDEKQWKKFQAIKLLKKSGLGLLIKSLRQFAKTPGIKWLTGQQVKELEPNIKGEPIGGFIMSTMGIVEPQEVCMAMAENAVENGVTFKLNTQVLDIIKTQDAVSSVVTSESVINCKIAINCAGVYADNIAQMVDDRFYTIHPRRGAIVIFDKNRKGFLNTPAGAMGGSDRSSNSKGGGASITPEGNMLWGPTAIETHDKENKSVDASEIDYIMSLGSGITDEIKRNEIITYFSGVRAPDYKEDFIIEASKKVKGFIHVAGIQSPGLASAPAIAQMVEKIVLRQDIEIKEKQNYTSTRKAPVKFRNLSHEEQNGWIKKDSKYGQIICRCELITEGEIVDAIHSPIPATTIDAVKRRTRAGMGRCQGGFCGPRVLEIIARELDIPLTEVTLKGSDSYVLNKENRG